MPSTSSAHADPPTGPRRRRRWGIVVVGLLLGGAAIWFLGPDDARPDGPRYLTAPVERRQVIQTVEATGRLVPANPRVVLAPVEGVLEAVHVRAGDRVERGQVLAQVTAGASQGALRARRAALASARAALSRAELELGQAQRRLARLERLKAGQRASPAELEEARAQVEQAEGSVRVAKAEVRVAKAEAREAAARAEGAVTASADGVVLRVRAELGAAVGPSGPTLFELTGSLDALEIEARVNEADIATIREGQPGTFQVRAHPGRDFDAEVRRVGVSAEQVDGVVSFPVWLRAENPERLLLPGMSATLRFEVRRREGLAVREAALRFRPEGAGEAPPRSRVFRVTDDGVAPVNVVTGPSDGVFVSIESTKNGILKEGHAVAVGVMRPGEAGGGGLSLGGGS